jgi:hypothetical protein
VGVLSRLAELKGQWSGASQLWLAPGQPARVSETTATVADAGQGRFVTLAYTWADKDKPQDGLLVIGFEQSRGVVTAYWLDSWHMSDKVMLCEGTVGDDGAIEVAGAYAAPPDPDWGWTIRIEPGDESFRLLMHNVSPGGEAALAVEAVFRRVFR